MQSLTNSSASLTQAQFLVVLTAALADHGLPNCRHSQRGPSHRVVTPSVHRPECDCDSQVEWLWSDDDERRARLVHQTPVDVFDENWEIFIQGRCLAHYPQVGLLRITAEVKRWLQDHMADKSAYYDVRHNFALGQCYDAGLHAIFVQAEFQPSWRFVPLTRYRDSTWQSTVKELGADIARCCLSWEKEASQLAQLLKHKVRS